MRTYLAVLFAAMLIPGVATAADNAAEVLIVGTYHFSNPGKDQHNVVSDDVLLPERQKQLEAIDTALARFKPTRVAVEWPAALVDERYAKFLASTLEPSRNEVVQLGFRAAKTAELKRVNGIDVDGDFPYEPVAAWAAKNGRDADLAREQEKVAAWVKSIGRLQQTGVSAALREMNRPEVIDDGNRFYSELLRYGSGDDQPGAKLLASWTARNIEICARLVQLARPGERVLVFYGSGHSYLLRRCVRETPGLRLIEANDYLP